MSSFERLARVYSVVERMRSVELRAAAAAVAEVTRAASFESAMTIEQRVLGHLALSAADRVEWSLAQAQQQAGEVRSARLNAMVPDLNGVHEEAQAAYRASRLQSEQMARAHARLMASLQAEADRRAQSVADDRFLSRRAWMRTQDANTLKR